MKFAWKPASFERTPKFPTWDEILGNLGASIDSHVRDRYGTVGMTTGRDYLIRWIAGLIHHSNYRLPYLFLHGPKDSGKSLMHECISCLLYAHSVNIGKMLNRSTVINEPMADVCLAIIDNKLLNDSETIKLNTWVNDEFVTIKSLIRPPSLVKNSLHWIHCAKSIAELPEIHYSSGLVNIKTSAVTKMTDKRHLLRRLNYEAPSLLAYILVMDIPNSLDPV